MCAHYNWYFVSLRKWKLQFCWRLAKMLSYQVPNWNFSSIVEFINLSSFCDVVFFWRKTYFSDNLWSWPFLRTIFFFSPQIFLPHALRLIMKQNRPIIGFLRKLGDDEETFETRQNADIDHPANADLTDKQFIIGQEILHSIIAFN